MRRIPHPYRNGELVIVIDCSDLDRSARFWSDVLGYAAGAATYGHYRSLTPESGEGIEVLLQQVDDEKHGKKSDDQLDVGIRRRGRARAGNAGNLRHLRLEAIRWWLLGHGAST